MTKPAMIRIAVALAIGLAATQAQAGQDVPPPRAIRPVQPLLAAVPPSPAYAAAPGLWRDTPPVMQGWSQDRHIPVVGLAAVDDGLFGEDADFDDDGLSPWGDM
jgi:hypothetical protein